MKWTKTVGVWEINMLFGIFNVVSCPECWSPFKSIAEIAAHFQEVDSGVTDMVSECMCVYQDSICICPF